MTRSVKTNHPSWCSRSQNCHDEGYHSTIAFVDVHAEVHSYLVLDLVQSTAHSGRKAIDIMRSGQRSPIRMTVSEARDFCDKLEEMIQTAR